MAEQEQKGNDLLELLKRLAPNILRRERIDQGLIPGTEPSPSVAPSPQTPEENLPKRPESSQ